MLEQIISTITHFIIEAISFFGYSGVVILMAIESACIPLPSEIIMPFAGYLVWESRFTILEAAVSGAFGCLIGSIVAYVVGYYGGTPLLRKYGRYILISSRDIDIAESWFKKHGDSTIFFSRLLPVIRTFISLPAGIARMNFVKFCFYTFVGSLPWCYALAYGGYILGKNWLKIRSYLHHFDNIIIALVIFLIIWWVYKHLKHK